MSILLVPLFLLFAQPLSAQTPRVDALGDALPSGAIARLGTSRLRSSATISALAFSPDGQMIAVGNYGSNRISILDACGKREVAYLGTECEYVREMQQLFFLPNGKALLSFPEGGPISLWSLPEREEIWRVEPGRSPHVVALSPDGRMLYVGAPVFTGDMVDLHRGVIRILDVATGDQLEEIKTSFWIEHMAVSPDGKTLAGADLLNLALWDTNSRKLLHQVRLGEHYVNTLAFSPNSQFLAAAGSDSLVILKTATAKPEHVFKRTERIYIEGAIFAPDGKSLAVNLLRFSPDRDQVVELWDTSTGQLVRPLVENGDCGRQISFSPDGKVLAATTHSAVRLWDTATGKQLSSMVGHTGRIVDLHLSANGKSVLSLGTDNYVRSWDIRTGRELRSERLVVDYLDRIRALDPDGTAVFVDSYQCVLRQDRVTGKELQKYEEWDHVFPFALSSDRALLGVSTGCYRFAIWDTRIGKKRLEIELEKQEQTGYIQTTAMAFSPDNAYVASFVGDAVRTWDAKTGRKCVTFEGSKESVRHLVFAPDGRNLAAVRDEDILVWETATGKKRNAFPASKFMAQVAAISPTGRLLAVGDATGTIRCLDLATEKQVALLRGHEGSILRLVFSPDGRALLSGSCDTTILIWDVAHLTEPIPIGTERLASAELTALWADLQKDDGVKAQAAVWRLSTTDPGIVPLLREHLFAFAERYGNIPKRLAALDDDDFTIRERASRDLALFGADAEPQVRQLLRVTTSAEVRRRLHELLENMGKAPMGERLACLRAVEVLEHVGTEEVRQVLADVIKRTPPSELERQAKTSLGRLKR